MANITHNKLRQIRWAKEYLWEIVFHEAPAPFNDWFPAETISQNVWSIDSRVVASLYPMQNMSSPFTLDVTFLDDENHTVMEWLRGLVNGVMLTHDGKPRGYLEDACTPVSIRRLNAKKEAKHSEGLWVFPTGSMDFEGSNQSESASKQAQFLIVGSFGVAEDH